MPELPEVQTIVNDLNKKVVGEQIVDFWSDWKKNVRPNFSKFKKDIARAKIIGARRIGKQIIIDLSTNNSIIIHLKMSGHLLFKKPIANSLQPTARRSFGSAKTSSSSDKTVSSLRASERSGEALQSGIINSSSLRDLIFKERSDYKNGSTLVVRRSPKQSRNTENYFNERVNQYIHHAFTFKSGSTLEFSDMRKFAWLSVVKTTEVENTKEIQKLGIDSLSPAFNLKKFREILAKKQKSIIGTLLLDQSLIAGIGNIYRSEILFLAGVNPKRKVSSLNQKEIEKIFKAIKPILNKAVKMRGTTDSDYRDTEGKSGNFQKVLNVYGREGEVCNKCLPATKFARKQSWVGKDKIIREKLGQRSTFFCPKCQK